MSHIRVIKRPNPGTSEMKVISAIPFGAISGSQEYGIHEAFKYGDSRALEHLKPSHPMEAVVAAVS